MEAIEIERDIERFLAVGSGSGYGSGSGDGSGVKEFNGRKVYYIDKVLTLIYAVRGNVAKGAVLCSDMTLNDCWIAKRGNFFAHGDTLHEAVEAVEAKWMENRPLDERIAEFVKTHPSLDEPYGDLFEWHTSSPAPASSEGDNGARNMATSRRTASPCGHSSRRPWATTAVMSSGG